jgi:hypothetical protein
VRHHLVNILHLLCLWRKVQDVGLAQPYRQHDSVQRLIRKVMAIVFLPLALVRNNLQLQVVSPEWQAAARGYPALNDFMRYFMTTYMDDNGNFPPRLWNIFNRYINSRINNYMEGVRSL